ncbi:hypothetical protein JRQ81_012788 [Phrynocephalus forsythii]|uniref:Vexin n=1 Tax=Phrynocephalus forsythii TaxID=171643 RepID=A0A9Q1B625_9SAUR|nr:hypothetical protein JRQ81_012788 [Phrynocephalus forsythii]
MHQIYSCSDENLEVFTVISSKSCSPVRRKAKSTQCILSKKVIAVSDYQPQGTEDRSHEGGFIPIFCKDESGHLQNKQQRFFSSPTKCRATHAGISKQPSFCCSSNRPDAESSPQASPISRHNARRIASTEQATKDSVFVEGHGRLSRKNTEEEMSAIQENEAYLPLTTSTLYGTPSLLRKIWMKHKKKSEYLGATNSAFEAD